MATSTLTLSEALSDKRIDILRALAAGGSISQAARAVGVSYKAAWQALDTLTNLSGTPLVVRSVGGAGGGGARLTDAGHELLAAAQAMAQARGAVLARWQASPHTGAALARLAVRTSMRNQWPCVVEQVLVQGPLVQVLLRMEGLPAQPEKSGVADVEGARGRQKLGAVNAAQVSVQPPAIAARITLESAQLLGLQPGLPVQALCKATAVRIEKAGGVANSHPVPASVPGVLRWAAKATRVVRGPAGDEVAAQLLHSGVQVVGFAAAGSGLRAGSRVAVLLDDHAVVLALAQD